MTKTNSAPMSVQMAETLRKSYRDFQWHYDHGFVVRSAYQVGEAHGIEALLDYGRSYVDTFVQEDGTIRSYDVDEYNLDQVNPGRNVFLLYHQNQQGKYRKAIELLRGQLRNHPRTPSGGFWHKRIYPHQMWLDGLFMASPFYAEYAQTFGEAQVFDDILHQVRLFEEHARDPKTGLYYHAWDESKQQRWANPETGCSPHFWGRAMGWYGMALIDILDHFPEQHSARGELVTALRHVAEAAAKVQDPSGLWWQVLDLGRREGNYLESSATSMFVCALAKGVRLGYLPEDPYRMVAQRGYQGLLDRQVTYGAEGQVLLGGICSVAGLGGNPYRDGSFAYYISEKIAINDFKGAGAFMLAGLELERLGTRA
jgi:unsaturated rhamnogalacturonyl hydrolase